MVPYPPSKEEAIFYYVGLPSRPLLVARSGTTPWEEATGQWRYSKRKDLRPVGNHSIKNVWEDNLAFELHALLDSMEVKWTSTDVVRIGDVEESYGPVVLWIGVMPASLFGNDAVVVVSKCQELLVRYDIDDVEVEIRESVVTRSDGPKLFKPPKSSWYTSDHTQGICEPLTTTLGLPICAQSASWTEGTGGFFITEGENTERLLLVTARHVVFPPDENKHFECKDDSQHRHNVTLFGDAAFTNYLKAIKYEIDGKPVTLDYHERRIEAMEGLDDPDANAEREDAQKKLNEAWKAVPVLNTLYQDVSTCWATPESRILGHVILSPPIGGGGSSEGYTEDWAVIEIDPSKVDASNFEGNAIDLGTRISVPEFVRMMSPNEELKGRSVKYSWDRLLQLKGTISDEEMRNPTAFDENNDPCIMVVKRGNTTGLTIGRANDVFSYARSYYDGDESQPSKEWAILPQDSKSSAFSAKGDSGSVIVDGLGRIGGLLTSGAGHIFPPWGGSELDITYATPISFLLKCMQDSGLHEPNVNPVLAA